MVSLKKTGMKQRHWDQISEKIGTPIEVDEGFTFTKVLGYGLLNCVDFCSEVGERAFKEN